MKTATWLVVLVLLLASQLTVFAQGRLDAIREDIRREEPAEQCDDDDDRHRRDHDDDDSWFCIDLNFSGNGRRPIHRGFPAHPYPLGLPGYVQIDPTSISKSTGNPGDELDLKWWSARLSLENGNDFDGMNRFGGTLLAETQMGPGIYTSWNWLHEELRRGRTDEATLGNITVTWRFLESEHLLMRVGIGAWIFADGCCSDGGINAHLSADLFPVEPWVVSAIIEGGGIGNAGIFHTRATMGYLWLGLEIFAGYDYISINDTSIQGPLAGVRVWF